MFNFVEKHLGFFIGAFLFIAIVAWIWAAYAQADYISKHNCILVGVESSSTGFSTSGNVIILPGKRSYKCDNGLVITI